MKTCVFAGTFDPITLGHENIIEKCLGSFDKVLLVIGQNPNKTTCFTESQRLEMIKSVYLDNPKVEVVLYSNHKDDYKNFLLSQNATVYVRGIRDQKDLEFEKQMEEKNKTIYPFITTEYVYCDTDFLGVSSTRVRELIKNGSGYEKYLSPNVLKLVNEYLK